MNVISTREGVSDIRGLEKKRQALKIPKLGRPREHAISLESGALLTSSAWAICTSDVSLQFYEVQRKAEISLASCGNALPHCPGKCEVANVSSYVEVTVHPFLPILTKKKTIQTNSTTLDTITVCTGHPDKHQQEFAKSKRGQYILRKVNYIVHS